MATTAKPNPSINIYTDVGHVRPMPPGMDHTRLAPLTKEAQEYIHHRQHIPNCSKIQLMVSHGYDSGFGSEIHVIGAMLAFALEHNHTLVLGPSACNTFTDGAGCARLFQPISNCDYHTIIEHHPIPTTLSLNTLRIGSTTAPDGIASFVHYPRDLTTVIKDIVPVVLKKALRTRHPSMHDDEIKYWWRAQSTAYIMRLNADTLQAVAKLRTDQSLHYTTNSTNTPLPLPANTIAMHIRGGDKWQEMTLVPPLRYTQAAIGIIRNAPLSLAIRRIFVSADDEAAITETRRAAEEAQLSVIYSHIPRQVGGHSLQVWKQQGNTLAKTHTHLLQLLMSLEADSWIGTRASNWNRLIDELRCVWVEKCQGLYTEVGDSYEGFSW